MKSYIITTSLAFIVIDNKHNVVDYQLYDNPVDMLKNIEEKILSEDEIDLINRLSEDYDKIIVETNKNIYTYENILFFDKISVELHNSYGDYVREHFDDIIKDIADIDVDLELNQIFQDFTSKKIRESIKSNDVMIIETINSLEEIEDTTGKLIERLREWCTPYIPELSKLRNHELYAHIISVETSRENIRKSSLLEGTNIVLTDDYVVDISDSDLDIIKNYATSVYNLYQTRNTLEKFIDEKIKDIAPNMYDVAGANLSAKLIAHTNGLENLAKLPSSTVQIIGAEKAMFRHLKTGENPPKHGLIYQHPSIRGSNWWIRGKLARAIAGKISIASRKDAFSTDYDPNLRASLDERIEEIKKEYPFAPRKTKNDESKKSKKKNKKRKNKRNKRKLRKGEYTY